MFSADFTKAPRAIVFVFLTVFPAFILAEASAQELKLIPLPQTVAQTNGVFDFKGKTGITLGKADDAQDRFAALQLADEVETDLGIRIGVSGDGGDGRRILMGVAGRDAVIDAELKRLGAKVPDKGREAYLLSVRPDGIVIAGVGNEGVFYGVQTLKQLVRANAAGTAIPCCEISDWPALRIRGWQEDISRGPIPTLEYLKRQIRTMSEFKLNFFTMYTEHVFKLDKHPRIAPNEGLTAAEVKELSEYARSYHVEVAGNFQAFGHFANILRVDGYQQLGENWWIITPAKEESYTFLKDVLGEIAPAYDSPLFVINCDETYGLGEGPSKKMVAEIGVGGVYAYHINRLNDILKPMGKRCMMWGDIALHNRDIIPKLPKDLIVLSWGYHAGKSFDDAILPFTEMGFEFMVCPGVSCWSRIFPLTATATVNISNYTRDGARHGALGTLNTTWDDDGENLYSNNWHPLVWGAECAWSPAIPKDASIDGDVERENRLKRFNGAFGPAFFGARDNAYAEAILMLEEMSRNPLAGEFMDGCFWADPFASPVMRLEAAKAAAGKLVSSADAVLAKISEARTKYAHNADALDFMAFATRRVRFLGLRTLTRIQIGERLKVLDAGAPDPREAEAALVGARIGALALLDEAVKLRDEYGRLWLSENRVWWLDENLRKYDRLEKTMLDKRDAIAKALYGLRAEGRVPSAESLGLDLAETGVRNTSARFDAAMAEMKSAWLEGGGDARIPIVWQAGKFARIDCPVEMVLPRGGAFDRFLPLKPEKVAMAEEMKDGSLKPVPCQVDGGGCLTWVVPGRTDAGGRRIFWLYPEANIAPPVPSGAVSARPDDAGGFWIENDRIAARVMPEGGHIYVWKVKALGGLDVTQPGEADWFGFSDAGWGERAKKHRIELVAAGPVMARLRCIPETDGIARELTFRAGKGLCEVTLDAGVGFYWDYDDAEVMGRRSKTPGAYLFSDGAAGELPETGDLSVAQPNTVWGFKHRPDRLMLASITPGVPTTHRVGPGGGMGGTGIEGGQAASHFVTVCDVIEADHAGTCNELAETLNLKSQATVSIGPAMPRTGKE
ncbi:MAG TPA: beta-N-acetylhexosaminidase [Candidatus Brocadiia bacterium]|nr:beta-N-acetylhexosaminidase [Candidatus Brocadiia bacterium]